MQCKSGGEGAKLDRVAGLPQHVIKMFSFACAYNMQQYSKLVAGLLRSPLPGGLTSEAFFKSKRVRKQFDEIDTAYKAWAGEPKGPTCGSSGSQGGGPERGGNTGATDGDEADTSKKLKEAARPRAEDALKQKVVYVTPNVDSTLTRQVQVQTMACLGQRMLAVFDFKNDMWAKIYEGHNKYQSVRHLAAATPNLLGHVGLWQYPGYETVQGWTAQA